MSHVRRVGSLSLGAALLSLVGVHCADEVVVQPSDGSTGAAGEAGAPSTAAGGEPGSGGSGTTGGSGGGVGTGGSPGSGGTGGEPIDPPEDPALTFVPMTLPEAGGTTDFGFIPTRPDELLVLMHSGRVAHYRLTETGLEFLASVTLSDIFFDEGCGLLSLAFDPEFEDNGFIYLSRCREQTETVITRHEFGGLSLAGILESEVDILSVTQEVAEEDWHRLGSIGFEPDGETMWALLGDLFIRENGQDPSNKAGSLLRFLPNRTRNGSGYEPATGNAFDSEEDGDLSIYAYGLRSPWRGSRDRFGRFWVGDVGLYTTEEVNLVTAPGQNFGWDGFEGPCAEDCDDLENPLTHYGRQSDEPYVIEDPLTEPATKRAVWVGEAYENPSQDRYYGLFDDSVMFGDFFTGWMRQLRVDEDGALVDDRSVGHLTRVTSWRTGPDGYMYVLTLGAILHRAEQVLP